MSRTTAVACARSLGGLAILAAVFWRVGSGPFLAGVRAVTWSSVVVAILITAATTTCCARRWQIVAGGLGVSVRSPGAIAAYYRSQLLNTVLPAGILGDVHRGVEHGRAAGNLGRGLRAVAWERTAGQVVQLGLAVILLLVLPSPARAALPIVLTAAVLLVAGLAAAARLTPGSDLSLRSRALRSARSDIRHGLLSRRAWPEILVWSVLAVTGHVALFLVAANAAGEHAGVRVLCPIAVLAFVAAALPTNVGGWGPREGVAGWAFASAGLGAHQGVAVATTFGVLVLIANLPGALVLIAGAKRHRSAGQDRGPGTFRALPSLTTNELAGTRRRA